MRFFLHPVLVAARYRRSVRYDFSIPNIPPPRHRWNDIFLPLRRNATFEIPESRVCNRSVQPTGFLVSRHFITRSLLSFKQSFVHRPSLVCATFESFSRRPPGPLDESSEGPCAFSNRLRSLDVRPMLVAISPLAILAGDPPQSRRPAPRPVPSDARADRD